MSKKAAKPAHRKTARPAARTARTAAERVHSRVASHSLVVRGVECQDWDRRKRLEADAEDWLLWYLPDAFTRPFDEPHRRIIRGVMTAHETGGRFAIAAERGIGKSAVMYGMILYLALTGRRRFPVYLPWSAPPMKRGLTFWRAAMSFNVRILADYRWISAPFFHASGYSARLPAQRWSDTEEPCGAILQLSDGMIVLPDNRGAIGGSTVNGNPRGMNLPQTDGAILRPDLALVDDPQDRKVARSVTLVSETCAKIDADIAGLGGAGAAFPLLLSGNCIAAGDVMARYLSDKTWRSVRVSCIEQWPDGWADKGPAYLAWESWWSEYQDDPVKGLTYYTERKAAMTAGMVLSAPNAYADKADDCLPDAYCVAMRQYWQMGHIAFTAERQQTPLSIEDRAVLVVSPSCVAERAIGPARGKPIDGAVRIVAGADINHGGTSRLGPRITWTVMSFARNQVAAVMAYGRERIVMPSNATQGQSAEACFAALERVRAKVGAIGADVLFYDARGQWAPRGVALRYAMQRIPGATVPLVPAEGWSNEYYRPTHKSAVRTFEGGHECSDVVDGVRVRWVAWNADLWAEAALRSWLAVPGAPGSCVLYTGEHEREFAEQVTMKRLAGKLNTSRGVRYDWADKPGDQDYADAVGMAWAAASWAGVGTSGGMQAQSPARAHVVIYRPSQHRR
jgi:hypothetical protein